MFLRSTMGSKETYEIMIACLACLPAFSFAWAFQKWWNKTEKHPKLLYEVLLDSEDLDVEMSFNMGANDD